MSEIPGLRLLGAPRLSIIAFTSDRFHVYRLADEMKSRGWLLNLLQVYIYI